MATPTTTSSREARSKGEGEGEGREGENDHLVQSTDPQHPANLIPELCRKFWTLGWVTGTGGGASIRDGDLVYLAPSGVQKELMSPEDIYVLSMRAQVDPKQRIYLRSPAAFKPSQCTPLFMAAFTKRDAACCIHTHSQWAVLITLLLETSGAASPSTSAISTSTTTTPARNVFEINNIEQIKGFTRGWQKAGNLGYHDTLRIPVIENTPFEEDLTESLEQAMHDFPDAPAVLVRRHGVYVWGDSVAKAKTMAESLDYLLQLAVEMRRLGLPWISDIA
ncbi:methylthioribulose-1-phosphate dehydratase [Phlyctema vagabunda]|uniref:Methylthioribulose-1-phosphate dehydratase n=1 Tax=Phlyctema vagabunda TaxID=108571 RepID=A0ABR4P3M9_9HELO